MRTRMRVVGLAVLAVFSWAVPKADAHRLEPLSTEFAVPFTPKAGGLEVTYGFEREHAGASEQAIPEMELELGLFPRLQMNVAYPLLRIDEGRGEPARTGGGKLELGVRYLLIGGGPHSYAVSLHAGVETPTGTHDLVDDATELGAALHVDKNLAKRLRFHSNLGWQTTAGGSEPPERIFFHRNALVWMATLRWNPVLELLGEIETRTGESKLAIQPEIILWLNRHLEFKVGVPVGLTSSTPAIGVRAQISILWGSEGNHH